MSQTLHCPNCHAEFQPVRHVKSRWAIAGSAGLLGAIATESILGGILVGGLSYALAAAIDSLYFSRRCPECGTFVDALRPAAAQRPTAAEAVA